MRKTRTMEIRAWIDNQARPIRTALEIAQEIVEEDHAFCQMLLHTLGNDATWGYRETRNIARALFARVTV